MAEDSGARRADGRAQAAPEADWLRPSTKHGAGKGANRSHGYGLGAVTSLGMRVNFSLQDLCHFTPTP